MKKASMASKCLACIVFLLCYPVVALLCYKIFSNYYEIILAMSFMLYGVAIWFVLKQLLEPYYKMRKMYQQFLEGKIYEELFEADYSFIPEYKPVLKQFYHLLNKQDALNISKKQAEYMALQNQINPHFLYNTLEAIRGDALCAGLDSIAETTEALSTYFRYTITGVENLVTLEDELENVENYFTIQRYRFSEKLHLNIQYPTEENVTQFNIPKLILQPLVENSIYHGLEGKKNGGTVGIKIELTEKKLLINVSDDGMGISEEQTNTINDYLERVAVSYVGHDNKKRGGIALKNVNSRIKLIFGEDYGIHVYSTLGVGTEIKITLPRVVKGAEYAKRDN